MILVHGVASQYVIYWFLDFTRETGWNILSCPRTLHDRRDVVANVGPLGRKPFLPSFQVKLNGFPPLWRSVLHFFPFSHLRVPVPLSRYLYHLQYFVLAYFLTAVGFNIAEIIQLLPYNQTASVDVDSLKNHTFTALNSSSWDNSSFLSQHNRRWRVNNHLLANGTQWRVWEEYMLYYFSG